MKKYLPAAKSFITIALPWTGRPPGNPGGREAIMQLLHHHHHHSFLSCSREGVRQTSKPVSPVHILLILLLLLARCWAPESWAPPPAPPPAPAPPTPPAMESTDLTQSLKDWADLSNEYAVRKRGHAHFWLKKKKVGTFLGLKLVGKKKKQQQRPHPNLFLAINGHFFWVLTLLVKGQLPKVILETLLLILTTIASLKVTQTWWLFFYFYIIFFFRVCKTSTRGTRRSWTRSSACRRSAPAGSSTRDTGDTTQPIPLAWI